MHRKSQVVSLLARRLGCVRATRLTSLSQRLSEAGQIHTNSGPPYGACTMTEVARMLLVGVVDEGLANAPRTVEKYGELAGPNSTTLEGALAHALSRPDSLPPICSGMEIHTGDAPYVLLTTLTADGAKTAVFGDMPEIETVYRTVVISGAALFAIASELAGHPAHAVDDLLKGMK